MKNKYIIVRKNSSDGAFIVERNECAPGVNQWTKADVAGYADTKKEAETIARIENEDEELAQIDSCLANIGDSNENHHD